MDNFADAHIHTGFFFFNYLVYMILTDLRMLSIKRNITINFSRKLTDICMAWNELEMNPLPAQWDSTSSKRKRTYRCKTIHWHCQMLLLIRLAYSYNKSGKRPVRDT